MLATFCLRLAAGLVACLLPLSPAQVNPRFYRTHFLVALALSVGALALGWGGLGFWPKLALGAAAAVAFLGSLSWSLEGAPAGRTLIVLATGLLAAALVLAELQPDQKGDPAWRAANGLTSAALLGAATSAMLMGHSYLIAPGMSLTPLLRLLDVLGAALVLRMAVAGAALWSWTAEHSLFNLGNETVLWLPLRWGLGFLGPLVLGWMAWESARIRSTQSATGILYVVVIFCFLGELTSQLLLGDSGYTL
jgi:hypothetical protein